MGMLLLIVVLSAFFVFFSTEMSGFFKKWYEVYWVRVFVSLIIISWLWIWYDELIPLSLESLQAGLIWGVTGFSQFFPNPMQWIVKALVLFMLASLPVLGVYVYFRRKGVAQTKSEVMMRVYIFSWVFFSVLLLS